MTDNQKPTLSDEDRIRIEKEISRIWFRTDTADRKPIELLKEIAEYATTYEREQQANLKQDDSWLKKLEFYTKGFDTKKFQKVEEYVKWIRVRDDLPKEPLSDVEAERSEVVDEIRKTINHLKNSHLLTPTPHPDAPINFLQSLLDRLNSLKK